MLYNSFENQHISALGFGAMRLPVIEGVNAQVDQARTDEMVAYAIKNGVNYFDTAWGYHDGNSETALGKALSAYPRESFYLADKFPGYDVKNMDKVEAIFEEQLKRCDVEYFDFYLIHNVCEMNIDAYLNPEYGILEYLLKQKNNGRIKHFGFSAHGSVKVIERFLEVYGSAMEFCQLQINWLDWEFQDARKKAELAAKHNLPLIVMEPLRGGKLVNLGDNDAAELANIRPDENAVSVAFRFIQSLPNVFVTLSGMSDLDQLTENISIFNENKPLDAEEIKKLLALAKDMTTRTGVPCTECRYCTSHCPQGLDIPHLLSLYNEHAFTGGGFLASMAASVLPDDKKPSACIECHACEAVCPQQILISETLKDFAEKLKG